MCIYVIESTIQVEEILLSDNFKTNDVVFGRMLGFKEPT